jgi:diacylglycerol O-acyltransferase
MPASYERLSRDMTRRLGYEGPAFTRIDTAVIVLEPLGGGTLTYEDIVAHVEPRLDRLPRFRRRVQHVPVGLGRPIWVDDRDFDIRRHVRDASRDVPADQDGLAKLAAAAAARKLSLDHAPWRIDVLPDYPGGRLALVLAAHHSLTADTPALQLVGALLADGADIDNGSERPAWHPAPPPGRRQLAAEAMRERYADLGRVREVGAKLAGSREILREALRPEVVRALRENLAPAAPEARLPASPVPGVSAALWTRPLAALWTVKRNAFADPRVSGLVTMNDIVLAAFAGGLRDWMLARGRAPVDLRTKVPVLLARRPPGVENPVSQIFVDLPASEPDPALRLARVQAQTARRKAHRDADRLASVAAAASLLGPAISHRLLRPMMRNPRAQQAVVVNLPRLPRITIAGGQVSEAYAVPSIKPHAPLGLEILTDRTTMFLCLACDPGSVPRHDLLAERIEAAFEELGTAFAEPAGSAGQPVARR